MGIPKVMLSGRVELGQLLQLAGVLVLCVGTYFAMSGRIDEAIRIGNEATKRADKLDATLTVQMEAVKAKMDIGFERMAKQIEAMPLMTDRLSQITEQVRGLTAKQGEIDRTAYDAREATKRLELRVDHLDQQVNAPVAVRQTR